MCTSIYANIFAVYMHRYGLCRSYLCISVHICAYLCISNSTYILLGEQQNRERVQLEGFVFTESHTAKGNTAVSSRIDGMVSGPIHGPGVDAKEGAARSWLATPVADTIFIACFLPVPHGVGDSPGISSGQKR